MGAGLTEDALVGRPLAEQVVAAVDAGRRVERVLLASASRALEAAARARWPAAEVGGAGSTGGPGDALLLGLPSALLTHRLEDLLRLPALGAHLTVWNGGATHEDAVLSAWREVCGAPPAQLVRVAAPVSIPEGWAATPLIDVIRGDSVVQLRRALLEERGIDVPPGRLQTLTDRLAHHLRAYEAADGTLRIPVRATLLSRV